MSTADRVPSSSEAKNNSIANQPRDELIFELIKRRLDNELQRKNDLDSKASNLIGFMAITIGLLLGSGTFQLSTLSSNSSLSILYFVGIGILLISIGFALVALRLENGLMYLKFII